MIITKASSFLGRYALISCMVFSCEVVHAQSIEEKRESLTHRVSSSLGADIEKINREIHGLKEQLAVRYSTIYDESSLLIAEHESKKELSEINDIRGKIEALESRCRQIHLKSDRDYQEEYGFWGDDETTLSTLIAEYGSRQFLYIVPPEIMN